MLQDRGALVHREGGWALDPEITDLPESIQGIISARLDGVSADE